MRRAVRDSLRALAFAAALAGPLPAAAGAEGSPAAPVPEASCRVPQAGDPLPVAPRTDLAPLWARLSAEAAQARAEGIRPLNNRGSNYDAGPGGLDPAAVDFEARGR
jgi:hypothetical protein